MYNIKNSKELAKLINYTNLNNMITESEMAAFIEKAKAAFAEKYGHEPIEIPVVISDGARRLA